MSKFLTISCYCLVMTGLFACKSQNSMEEKDESSEFAGLEMAMQQEFRMTQDPQLNLIPKERLIAARSYMQTWRTAWLSVPPHWPGRKEDLPI